MTLKFLKAALKNLELHCFVESKLYFDGFLLNKDSEKELGQSYLAYQECRSLVLVLSRIYELCLQLQEKPLEFKLYVEIEQVIAGEVTLPGQTKHNIAQPISDNLLHRLAAMPDSIFSLKLNATPSQKLQTEKENPWTTEVSWDVDPMSELLSNRLVIETLKVFDLEMGCLLQLAKERQPAEDMLASCFN